MWGLLVGSGVGVANYFINRFFVRKVTAANGNGAQYTALLVVPKYLVFIGILALLAALGGREVVIYAAASMTLVCGALAIIGCIRAKNE